MQFNPINDYYSLDLSKEANRVYWDFWEFTKNLVTLSSPYNKQIEVMGSGAVADELAIDFETYYTLNYQSYLDNNLLNIELISKLDKLDKFLEVRSGDKMPEFWNDAFLGSHPD